jgi:hypothetical protein
MLKKYFERALPGVLPKRSQKMIQNILKEPYLESLKLPWIVEV